MRQPFLITATMTVLFPCFVFTGFVSAQTYPLKEGKMKVWYPVTITFEGPNVSETEATFTNYRLTITFTKGSKIYEVPGYFAADGNAANSSATSGNKWRVKFTPDEAGTWSYTVSFRTGTDVALGLHNNVGSGGTAPDGESGTFVIVPADTHAPGFYAKGMLRYVGEHYAQFQGNNEWFVKAGPGSPENFFGYADFDGTVYGGQATQSKANLGTDGLHNYVPHESDWKTGDPEWKIGKGHGIIGALNHISNVGGNTIYHIIFTRNADSDDTWPWAAENSTLVYDVSKLDQWAIVYEHMDRVGINADLYLCESENASDLNGGAMGRERSIYHREIIARFGFKLALRYNLGEENGLSTDELKANADNLHGLDPYNHPVGSHCSVDDGNRDAKYEPMLGYPTFDGAWMQLHENSTSDIHLEIKEWIDNSASANHKWICSDDESAAITETKTDQAEDHIWKVLMAGGDGMNIYTGYGSADYNDIGIEDFSKMDATLGYMVRAKNLFSLPEINPHLPYMAGRDGLVDNAGINTAPFCYAREGVVYVLYGTDGGSLDLDLSGQSGIFNVRWWDPRKGGILQEGSKTVVSGNNDNTDLGNPPSSISSSWAAVVTAGDDNLPPSTVNITSPPDGANFPPPADVTINVNATDSDGSVDRVEFYVNGNGTPAYTDYNAPYSYHMTSLPEGSYSILVRAYDNGGKSASGFITFSVSTNVTALTGWISGTPNNKVSGNNRLMTVMVMGEHSSSDFSATGVTYGGQAMTKRTERVYGTGYRTYAAIFTLNESGVNAASSGTIDVSWSRAPGDYNVYSVLLANVDQTTPVSATANNALSGTTVTTSALPAASGDMVIMCGATENNTTITFNNGFIKQFKSNSSWGGGTGGNKTGSGTSETPSFTQSASGRMVLCSLVAKKSPLETSSLELTAPEMPLPNETWLNQNYPNPFNPETTIPYQLAETTHVKLEIFNFQGRRVATLVNEQQSAGHYRVTWNATDANGNKVSSGMYVYRLRTNDMVQMKKFILLQ